MKRHILFLTIIGLTALLFTARADEESDTTVANVGDKAPQFTCETIGGESFSLKEHAGKVVVINFFATWCGPCLSELPHLEKEIYNVFKGNEDFTLLAVGREHTLDELRTFQAEKHLNLPFVPDPDRGIYGLYASKYIPRNVIIGRDGLVKYTSVGFTEEKLKEEVTIIQAELALKGEEPAPGMPVAKDPQR